MDDIGKVIRNLRKERGVTLKQVSEKTGLSISFLSQVERGKSSVTLQSISKISDALEVSRSYFFNDHKNKNKIYRRSDHEFNFHNSNFVYEGLSGNVKNQVFEPMLVLLLPNKENVQTSTHQGQEFIYVLEGTLTVLIEDEIMELEPGDSFHIDSTTPHTWYNATSEPVKLLYVYSRL
ncbi:XRE family transcriptional regulator [Bacillus oleivorans]|uniref:XRE family transcriptional regulator n=1 Tax=Bacillus oleivorans TaxID=1448271 RepID=A0A285CT80_9BACI|nr:XRE family transcriptional regulator [Bacillus oleivorans]SNX70789.1 XRE family transcriptional regulator [Bacillus oleivorans]